MDFINKEQGARLAIAFAEYSKIRVSEVHTRTDYLLAASTAKVLFNVQYETGVVVADQTNLIDLYTRLNSMAAKLARVA